MDNLADEGETVDYTIIITNTGNVRMNGIEVRESRKCRLAPHAGGAAGGAWHLGGCAASILPVNPLCFTCFGHVAGAVSPRTRTYPRLDNDVT